MRIRKHRMTLKEAFIKGYRKGLASRAKRKSIRESRRPRRRLSKRLQEKYYPSSDDEADAIGEVIYNSIMNIARYERTQDMEFQEFIQLIADQFEENEFEESVMEEIGDWEEYKEYNDGIIPDADDSAASAVHQAAQDSGVIESDDNGEYVLAAWYLDKLADILGDDSLRDKVYNKQFDDFGLV